MLVLYGMLQLNKIYRKYIFIDTLCWNDRDIMDKQGEIILPLTK